MSTDRRAAVVICPGRGTYNKDELGYLFRHHPDKTALIRAVDDHRLARGQVSIRELDTRESFDLGEFSRGDNASALIQACAYADFLSIDRDRYDIVAVTGNSMGWYIALGCANALQEADAIDVVNTMGTWMHESLIGGQLIYPLVDEQWRPVPGRRERLMALLGEIDAGPDQRLYLSIDLGGMMVFAGNEAALSALAQKLEPEQKHYPLRLHNHAAFHTPLQRPISERALARFGAERFHKPAIPLIDGSGRIWSRHASDPERMRDYTFGHQVCETYDFARALQVAVREFAPDDLIVLGPGSALGGAVAQTLIGIGWRDLQDRADFTRRQAEDPFLLSMGRPEQRPLVAPGRGMTLARDGINGAEGRDSIQ
ncbi:MAG: ACP S-malonyltransferase [Gammaproteobacteria bacterium]|nr:MAG: ACP S-malonyltransferase [Gammaproteobacteria bacterium]